MTAFQMTPGPPPVGYYGIDPASQVQVTFDDGQGNPGSLIRFEMPAGSVTNQMLRNSTGMSVIGRAASSTGPVADISAGQDHGVLRRSGFTLGFGPIRLDQAGAVDGHLSQERGGWGLSTIDWPPGALPQRNGFGTGWTYITGTTNGQPLIWQAFTNTAAFAALNLSTTTNTSGILPEARGGTGQARGAAPNVTLTGAVQNVTLNLTSNMATVLTATNAGTTNLTFTGASTARTRISYLVCVGAASGRVLNWPSGVDVYPPSGSAPELTYTIPAGVRTVVQLLQVQSNMFYRITG